MVYKIVFFDIDGTLMDGNKKIPYKTVEAINGLKEKGIKVFLATGRSPIHIQDVTEALEVNSYICFNGSIVFDKGEKLYDTIIDTDVVEKLVKVSTENNHALAFLTEDGCYRNVKDSQKIELAFNALKEKIPEFEPEIWKNEKVYQIYLFCEGEDQEFYEKMHPHLKFTRWHPYAVDVNTKKTNKSIGIKWLLKHLQIYPKESIAFGDNLNDLEMLSYVGMGIAMGNAIDVAKEKADFVTRPLNEDGIFFALEKLKII